MNVLTPIRTVDHPLDPLMAEEIKAASDILRRERRLPASARFGFIALSEPPKEAVLNFVKGDPVDREAFIVIRDSAERVTYEAVVSITSEKVRSWRRVEGVQPPLMLEEISPVEDAIRNDLRWQAAMRKRGVTDFQNVMIDPWFAGYTGPEDDPGKRRICRPLTWVRSAPNDHGYARPVEGLICLVDLDTMTVIDVEDHGVVPLPIRAGNYTAQALTDPNNFPHFADGPRKDLKAIEISQPDGASFQVEGNAVTWQKWHLRIGFTPREGLVLYQIGYDDKGRVRPIIYRASLSEMFVPYGDPNPTHYRKDAFDQGEIGIGLLANGLELGCDCLGAVRYFDGIVNDNNGDPLTLKNAICMHEEDYGVLWKHLDFRTGAVEVRRSRRLVVSMFATVGNYEYGYFWYFYQDGTIQYEVKITGVMSTGAIRKGKKPRYGTLVAPGLYGPNHQHFFNVRLDMMVDGPNNSVYEVNSGRVRKGKSNPAGNAWIARETLLSRESKAQREVNQKTARFWKITNPGIRNALDDPVAYTLIPGETAFPYFDADAYPLKRAGFTAKQLWVTRYDPKEMFAAGDYVYQHPGGAGLPAYTKADRDLRNTDVVLWVTVAAHHVPRTEEWPVTPVQYVGFRLRPHGFFDGNPALDVPEPKACRHAAP